MRRISGEDIVFGGIVGTALVAFWGAVAAGAVYAISPDPEQDTNPNLSDASNTVVESCVPDNARQLPSPANVQTIQDSRTGDIYACHYFLDMGVPYNTPTPIGKMTTEVYDVPSAEFEQSGSLGGFAILGTGGISGEFTGSGSSKTERKRVYVIQAEGNDNALRTLVLDAEKVSTKPCEDEANCQPTVEFKITDDPLWYKEEGTDRMFPIESQEADNTSIWLATGIHHGSRINNTRLSVVNQLSLGGGEDGAATGGPDFAGQVISALSSEIVLTLPRSAIENAS